MAEPIDFINISYVQFFTDVNCNNMNNNATTIDIDNVNSIDEIDNTMNEVTADIAVLNNFHIDEDNNIALSNDSQNESIINIQCFDSRCEDDLIPPPSCVNVNSKNLDICPNYPETPSGIKTGVIAKIPVVLAQLTIPFHISSVINLPELALEIKDVKKSLKLTQCILIQPTNILFIKGFVRKNINYSTMIHSNIEGVCGEIHHCTIDVPFECSTSVTFFKQPLEPHTNTRKEFQYLKEENLSKSIYDRKNKLISNDFSEFNQVSEEFFNELPFCKLISSRIVEFDEFINHSPQSDIKFPFEENFSVQIEEKMVIELKLEILQNINVVIPPIINDLTKINLKDIIT